MIVLLDTNLLTRSVQPRHPQHSEAAAALADLRMYGHRGLLVPQVLYEFWVVVTRPTGENGLRMSAERAELEVDRVTKLFRLLRDERAVFGHWYELVRRYTVIGKTGHDARLVAAMQRHGIKHIVTFNVRHFARFSEIQAVVPTGVSQLSSTH